jgi:hypothetical protein
MRIGFLSILLLAAASAAVSSPHAAQAADGAPGAAPVDEIIVRGRGWGGLRLQIQRAEEAVYERFNEINSDDLFDITCDWRNRPGSRVRQYACLSNSWREQEANYAAATARVIGGELGANPAQALAEQRRMQGKLRDEMRRLAVADEGLRAALLVLGEAYQTYNDLRGARPAWSFYREMPRREDGLPFDAQRAFEVQAGAEPWSQLLMWRTFTLGDVTGDIQRLELTCERHSERIRYEAGTDWTVPESWGACMVSVDAKRDTTFRFYEFQ